MLAFLSQSPMILDGADRAFYRRFMKGIGRTQHFLERKIAGGLAGEARLLAAIALAEFGLCAEGTGKLTARRARDCSPKSLARQILPDGGHISRNPESCSTCCSTCCPCGRPMPRGRCTPPPQLLNAIDRMMPMLRLFRHGDGALALVQRHGRDAARAARDHSCL